MFKSLGFSDYHIWYLIFSICLDKGVRKILLQRINFISENKDYKLLLMWNDWRNIKYCINILVEYPKKKRFKIQIEWKKILRSKIKPKFGFPLESIFSRINK